MVTAFSKFGQPIDKITAIKLYRAMFNLGLKDAKDAVEKMEYDLGEVAPNLFASRRVSNNTKGEYNHGECFGNSW